MARYPVGKIKGLLTKVGDVKVWPRTTRTYYPTNTYVNINENRGVRYDLGWATVTQEQADEVFAWLDENATEHNVTTTLTIRGSFWTPSSEETLASIEKVKEEKKAAAKAKREKAKKEKEQAEKAAARAAATDEELDMAAALAVLKKSGLKVVVVEDKER